MIAILMIIGYLCYVANWEYNNGFVDGWKPATKKLNEDLRLAFRKKG